MQSSPSAPTAMRAAGAAPTIQKRRSTCRRDLSSSFQRRRAPFGNSKAATQGQIASQVLQSMHERSSQHHSEGAPLRPLWVARHDNESSGKGDEALLRRVDDVEKRLARIHETMEGLIRGISKYTALATDVMRGRDEEALVQKVTAAVTVALGSLEHDAAIQAAERAENGGENSTRDKRRLAGPSPRPLSAGSCESCM